MHTKIHITLPKHYLAYTALDVVDVEETNDTKFYKFEGENVIETKMFLTTEEFKSYTLDSSTVITNINSKKIDHDKKKNILKNY